MTKKLTVFAFIILILGLGIAGLVFLASDSAPEPFFCNGQPCNVILIIPDALSARHMGIYGYERNTTPFIDEFFGKEGIVFENAWSNAPWTWPSFAALFTSQLASDVFVETWADRLSDTIPTFIDVLEKNGISKFAAHTFTVLPFPNVDANVITRFKPEERFQADDHFLFLKAIEWIKEQNENNSRDPFFLLIQPCAPHSPYHPPEPYRYFFGAPSEYPGHVTDEELIGAMRRLRAGDDVKTEEIERFRLQYDQQIRYLDDQIESFISQIPEEIIQNTIFIFTSDHGEAFGQHDTIGHGHILYEEVIHVPFLIRAPGIESRIIREPITLLDAGPTILDIFGLKNPKTFQGLSLMPIMQGKELHLEERIIRSEFVETPLISSEEIGKILPQVRTESLPYPRSIAVRRENWKLLQLSDGSFELYNLEQDPQEQDNLLSPFCLAWYFLSEEDRAEIFPLLEALGESPPLAAREKEWKLVRCIGEQLELYNLKQDPEQQNNLLNNDGIPQWHYLSREEQLEVVPLFDELGEEPPFVKI